ncbi:MAG: hypothetical protein JXQ82_07885 [Methanomicrobiaceae archaeon]|nr:hypothetical protein [Methanomicrobiaceae archaeon]
MPSRHHFQRCLHPHDARLRRQLVASAGRAHQSSTTPAHGGNTGASHSIDNFTPVKGVIEDRIERRIRENLKLSRLLEEYLSD